MVACNVPFVTKIRSLLTTLCTTPKPVIVPALVTVEPVIFPPSIVIVPLFTQARAALSVAPLLTAIKPVCVGATTSDRVPLLTLTLPLLASTPLIVPLPLRMTSPELTSVLPTAPMNANVPVLVTVPLKKVFCDTNTVAALLSPLLKVAPATPLVSTPVPLTIMREPLYVLPARLKLPPVTVAVPLIVALDDTK